MIRHARIFAAVAATVGVSMSVGQARAHDDPRSHTHEPETSTTESTEVESVEVEEVEEVEVETTKKDQPQPLTPAAGATPVASDQAELQRDVLAPPAFTGAGRESHLVTPFGVGVTLGGGVTDFTSEEARLSTDIGGSYGARVILGTRTPFAIELAYVGSAQSVDVLGIDEDALLIGNGGEATLRLNLGRPIIQPFIFGGFGFTHYSIENEDDPNTSAVLDEDDILTIPMGAGIAANYKRLVVDTRVGFRYALNEDMFEDGELHTWGANLNVGVEF